MDTIIPMPHVGETWRVRATGEPVAVTDSYATAITGGRVEVASARGRRWSMSLAAFRSRHEPIMTHPLPLDRAIAFAMAVGDGDYHMRVDQSGQMRLAMLTRDAAIASAGGDIDALAGTAAWAASWVAVLDTAGLPATTEVTRRMRREDVLTHDCRTVVITPYHPMSDTHWAAILIEAVGKVARALAPDATSPTGHAGDLRAELVQVAGVALAWAARRLDDAEKEEVG